MLDGGRSHGKKPPLRRRVDKRPRLDVNGNDKHVLALSPESLDEEEVGNSTNKAARHKKKEVMKYAKMVMDDEEEEDEERVNIISSAEEDPNKFFKMKFKGSSGRRKAK